MTAYSVAEKRRAKKRKAAIEGFELAATPKRNPDGRKPRGTTRAEREHHDSDPRKTALEARCRQEGRGMTKQDRIAVDRPRSGSHVGLCLEAMLGTQKVVKAWEAWCGYTAAMRTYERRILGKSVHAKTAKIEMEPERVETDDHHTVDERDEDQKDRDAVNNWMRWKGYAWEIGHIAAKQIEAARQDERGLWQNAAPTRQGVAVAYALQDLARAVESR